MTLLLNKEEIIRDDSGEYRTYKVVSIDKSYPSVNSILSAIAPNDGLVAWQKSVGKKKAEKIRNDSSNRGNAFHEMSESYLRKEELDNSNDLVNSLFEKAKPLLNKLTPIALEYKTYWSDPKNNNRGFAGTPDLMANICKSYLSIYPDDFLSETTNIIFDYKTWNKLKEPIGYKRNGGKYYPLIRYCLQLSAYIAAINQRTNKEYMLSEIIIIGVTEDELEPILYYWNVKAVMFYWSKFKQIMNCFYSEEPFDWKQMEVEAEKNNYLGERIYLK